MGLKRFADVPGFESVIIHAGNVGMSLVSELSAELRLIGECLPPSPFKTTAQDVFTRTIIAMEALEQKVLTLQSSSPTILKHEATNCETD